MEKKKAAMKQFNDGHWEQNPGQSAVAGGSYSSEMNQNAEYKNQVDKLAAYVKNNRAEH